MDGQQIKEMLNQKALEVCEYLLPGGKSDGKNYATGDVHGSAGQSLKVFISGPKTGVFHDFADDAVKGGNLLELWRQVKGCEFREALQQAKEWLGVQDEPWQSAAAYSPGRSAPRGKKKLDGELHPVQEGSKVWKYLTEERKINPDAMRRYRIGETFIKKGERNCIVFPSYDAAGNLVRLKYRDIADKKYMFLQPSKANASEYEHGAELHLFGIHGVDAKEDAIIICEGEIDALSFASDGYSAVSLPIGAQAGDTEEFCSHDHWIKNDYDWLEPFVSVFLATDADEPGQAARRMLIPRLGRERVYVVDYPTGCKDANDCLRKGFGLDGSIEHARNLDPEELRRAGEFRDQVWERFYPPDGKVPGDPLPWDIGKFRFRPGEVTVWHGYNSHGKSRALGHCLIHFAGQGRKACLASLEMPSAMTLQDMERQALTILKPETREAHDRAMNWLDQYIWVYDFVGAARSVSLLECWEYAAKKYGVHHFVLDSMMKLADVQSIDYESQKDLMNRLNDFAKKFNVHVHLVCHSKKPPSDRPKEKYPPQELDISGSSDVPNGAWNVIAVWRNEMRTIQVEKFREAIETGKMLHNGQLKKLTDEDCDKLQAEIYDLESEHDSRIIIQKDRVGGIYPMPKNLWFDHESWQFGDRKGFVPVRYLAEPDEAA